MLKKFLMGIIVVLVVQLAIAIGLVMWLGWWSIPALFVLNIVLGIVLVPRLMKRLLLVPFMMKGAALEAARSTVHSIVEKPRPDDYEETEGEGPRVFYDADVTVRPKYEGGKFRYWEPGDLVVSPVDAKAMEAGEETDIAYVADFRIWDGTAFVETEDAKFEGEQRVLLELVAKPGERRGRLRYYFELLDEIEFPAPQP